MFKVYVNDDLIFNDKLPDEDLCLVNPKLIIEDNQPGTFDFTLPFEHRFVNKTNQYGRPFCGSKTDTVTIYKNDEWFWEGRPVSETSDFYNRRVIHCEGALSYLGDTTLPLQVLISTTNISNSVAAFLNRVLNHHNNQLSGIERATGVDLSNRKIFVLAGSSIITVVPEDISTFTRITNFESSLESINKRLIDKLGGHIRIRRIPYGNNESRLILDYLKDYPDTSSQKIEFGKNLLDYNKSVDMTEIATAIIPRGDIVEEGSPFFNNNSAFSDISQRVDLDNIPVSDPYIYADQAVIKEYGYCEKIVIFENIDAKYSSNTNVYNRNTGWRSIDDYRNASDVTDVEDPNYRIDYIWALKILGENYLNNLQFEKLELELTVFDLTYLGVQNVQDFKLLDNVICSSKPHGMINKAFPIQKMEIIINDPESLVITLGESERKSISVTTGLSASTINADPGDYNEYYKNLLVKAKNQADALIEGAANGLSNGYLTIIKKTANDASRYSDGIIISNERIMPSEMTGNNYISALRATHPNMRMWIWNSGGLGYYDLSSGVNRLVTAITNNGQIVANAITTGTLSAIDISACTLTGCTFTCSNTPGGYYVKLANGKITGGYGSTKYGTFDVTASITDKAVTPNVVRKGFKFTCDALVFNAKRIAVPWPSDWISKYNEAHEYIGADYINTFTGIIRNVMSDAGGGSWHYGDLKFVNGLLVTAPTQGSHQFAFRKEPEDPL